MAITPITFKHRCVQDLAWVIQSPPLISGEINGTYWWGNKWFNTEFQACYPLLRQLDKQPKLLLEAIASTQSKRLGHYFETLVAYWFEISPNFELLLKSHQLRTPEKTLGEIDFLIRDKNTDKHIHLEVSVKFYLGVGNLDIMSNWHGPGLHDRLDRKFNHLRNHQTQLAEKHPDLMPYHVDESACMMKGRLFYPPEQPTGTCFTNDEHLFGYWYQLPELPPRITEATHLGKQYWMAELGSPDQLQSTVKAKFSPKRHPSLSEPGLFAGLDKDIEREHFFLLPEAFWTRLEQTD